MASKFNLRKIFQFKQLERRSLKKKKKKKKKKKNQGFNGIRTRDLRDTGALPTELWVMVFTAMITLHFHLQPQYKYELFHINFTSFHCTGRYELNKLTSLPMCGFIAQLVEHRTGIAEVTGSNPVEALIFFRLLLSNCLNWKIYCDDHSSLSLVSCYSCRSSLLRNKLKEITF